MTSSYEYDDAGRLTLLTHQSPISQSPISTYTYALDNVGNRRTLTETIAAVGDVPGGAYLESDGLVVLEAENGDRTNGVTHQWNLLTAQSGYTGTSYLQSSLDNDTLVQTTAITTSPRVDYLVNFTTAETYTVWVRGYAPNAAGDSLYVGLGAETVEVTGFGPREWTWANVSLSGSAAMLPVGSSGAYTVSLWMREDGLRIDRLLLTTDTTYIPTDFGPAESERLTDTVGIEWLVNRVIDYDYDNLYRLTDADYSTGETYQYSYDPVGNRLQQIIDGDTTEYLYDAANRLEQVAVSGQPVANYTFDANGNLLNSDVLTNTWDAANRLVSSTRDNSTIEPIYNGVGDRVGQTVGVTTTNFALDIAGGLPEIIYTSEGNAYLHLPGVIIAENDTGETRYLLTDGLGSIRQAIDENGAVVAYNEFDPYGNPVQNGSSPYGFTGEWWEDGAGLLHLRARWYSAGTGTFLSRDPWEGDDLRSQSMNGWSYVEGNPIRYVDPSGQCRGLTGYVLEACLRAKQTIQMKKRAIVIKVEFVLNSCQMLVHNVRSDPKAAAEEGVEVGVITGAELLHQHVYNNAAPFVEEYPQLYEVGNVGIAGGRMGAEAVTDMDPNTMGWEDLTMIWMFELGDYDDDYASRGGNGLVFGPEAATTKDLLAHTGGLNARENAINAIKGGSYSQGASANWDFNPKAAFNTVWTLNGLQFFMGSYNVNVDITNNGDGSYRLDYRFFNISGLTSATRYRARAHPGGPRRGIIPDDDRGEGFNTGGNFAQEWFSSETIVIEDRFIIHPEF